MKIVFSDLDGTILDHNTYSTGESKNIIELLGKKKIPLIFCTSKTFAENEFFRKELGNSDPFIVENGGAIYIPENYFSFQFPYTRKLKNYFVIDFGPKREVLLEAMDDLKSEGIEVRSFVNMSFEEIAEDADLSLEMAQLAKEREFTMPFKLLDESKINELKKFARAHDLNLTKGGRYFHLMGKFDKGEAVRKLSTLFKKEFNKIETIGFGDSQNDFEMLEAVDNGFLVGKIDGKYASNKFPHAEGIGPGGFSKKMTELLS